MTGARFAGFDMLPDFPVLKSELNGAITRFMRMRARVHQGPLAEVPRGLVFEGHANVIIREDGSEDITRMFEASSELRIPTDEIRELHLPVLLQKLDKSAHDIVAAQAKHFYETLAEGTEKAGTALDAKGGRLTVELFLRMIETILIDFKADGSPEMPVVHINPAQEEDVKAMIRRLETEPELKKRYDAIMMKKREEWRAREADRKLVG
jgi:hypothetical protein